MLAPALGGDLHAQNGHEDVARRAASALIRAGDRIDLRFLRDRELNATVTVNERGEAVLPKLGIVDVSGIRIGDLSRTLRERYVEFLRDPELDVQVSRRIVVNGEVRVPNVYYVDISSGVRDAIAGAGGVLETGNKKNVVIVRGSARIPVKNWENSTGPETDLMSGDQIIVGRKPWLVLNALSVISTSVIVIGLIQSLR